MAEAHNVPIVAAEGESERLHAHHPSLKQANDKSTYRLFPTASRRPQASPRTIQQTTLTRAGSVNKRRSVSLDDSSRHHAIAAMPFARVGEATVPRIQPVPVNRMKVTKAQDHHKSCTPSLYYYHPHSPANCLEAQNQNVLPYKPRVSEDAGHGRSCSAPEGSIKGGMTERQPRARNPVATGALAGSSNQNNVAGGSWFDDKAGNGSNHKRYESRQEKSGKMPPKLEKPLPPPPPKDKESHILLEPSHGRSYSTPLSPSPRRGFNLTPRSDSVTELTPLVTPSSLDPNRKSYFPFSSDVQMRKLMGISPIEENRGGAAHTEPMPPLPIPSSRFSITPASSGIPPVKISAAPRPRDANAAIDAESPKDVEEIPSNSFGQKNLAPPSPTFSQASSRLKPAALRITSPKRSVSVNSGFDRRPLRTDVHTTPSIQSAKPAVQPTSSNASTKVLASLSELIAQTDALHERYGKLRADRQELSSAISQGLREQQAGPEYVNTLLDQHMSLSTVCSSMDICLAKLKALNRKKDSLIKSLTEAKIAPGPSAIAFEARSSSLNSTKPTRQLSSARKPTLPATCYQQPQSANLSNENLPQTTPKSRSQQPAHQQKPTFDVEYDYSDSDTPRRMNIKGAKAAKILGLNIDPEPTTELQTLQPRTFLPTQTPKANLSTTSLDRDLFNKPPSPAPDRPLPSRPSIRRKERAHVPAPLPLETTRPAAHHAAQTSAGTSGLSSRASSPAEDRGAETPQEEHPNFDSAKSPSMQTVHVYFQDSPSHASSHYSSTFSEVGEDELLEYYGYLR